MTTPKKNRRAAPGLHAASLERKAARAPEPTLARSDVGGKLPGDETEDLFWEQRVADWLGVTRPRLVALRRRALVEGAHWIVHHQSIVYSVLGLEKLRELLRDLGEITPPVNPEEVRAMPAPAGPPERKVVVIAKLFTNTRLMQALAPESTVEKPIRVLVRVRDNRNFMPGMRVPVIHDPRSASWQFIGRLPRRKGHLHA